MNDELHNKLMEAGFYGDSIVETDGKIEHTVCPFADCCGASLSELIEACGNNFGDIKRMENGRFGARDASVSISTLADTPEDAVANLYLKLNEK